MNALREDIETLQRIAGICGRVIWPDGDDGQVTVPGDTLRQLAAEASAAMTRPRDYWLIKREVVWLCEAALEIQSAHAAGDVPRRDRWQRLAELVRAGIALDLRDACQVAGVAFE